MPEPFTPLLLNAANKLKYNNHNNNFRGGKKEK